MVKPPIAEIIYKKSEALLSQFQSYLLPAGLFDSPESTEGENVSGDNLFKNNQSVFLSQNNSLEMVDRETSYINNSSKEAFRDTEKILSFSTNAFKGVEKSLSESSLSENRLEKSSEAFSERLEKSSEVFSERLESSDKVISKGFKNSDRLILKTDSISRESSLYADSQSSINAFYQRDSQLFHNSSLEGIKEKSSSIMEKSEALRESTEKADSIIKSCEKRAEVFEGQIAIERQREALKELEINNFSRESITGLAEKELSQRERVINEINGFSSFERLEEKSSKSLMSYNERLESGAGVSQNISSGDVVSSNARESINISPTNNIYVEINEKVEVESLIDMLKQAIAEGISSGAEGLGSGV